MPPKTKPAAPGDATRLPPSKVFPLPTASIPAPPAGFVPPIARDLLGSHPRQVEVATASEVVDELRRFHDYDAMFGVTVPPAPKLAALLEVAIKWRAQRDAAAAWNLYVRAQDALAWKEALDQLDELKPAYKLAATRQPAIAQRTPRLALFFDAHRQIAQRASATKSRKKKAASNGPKDGSG